MKKVLFLSILSLAVMFSCASLDQLNYPSDKIVTTAPWSGSMNTTPTSLIVYSDIIFGTPKNEDWTRMMNVAIERAKGDAITNLRMDSANVCLLWTRMYIYGEVSKKK